MNEENEDQIENNKNRLMANLLDEKNIKGMEQRDEMSQDMLKKYILYSKKFCHPKLNDINKEKVAQFYADIRKETNVVGGLNIAVRHIESVIRMSEAHAKMHLRDYVRQEDIDFGIDMLLDSFL